MDILFGTISSTTARDDGVDEIAKSFIQLGKVISQQTTYCETIKITQESETLTHFLQLMDYVRADKKRFNPEYKVFTDQKTGKAYKVTKTWTESA